jgi:hypothetical protein
MSDTTNILKYTGLDYQNILLQIKDKLSADTRFSSFTESQIAQLTYELFAGVGDLLNYNIGRSFEESFFETLLRKSSAITLASNLFYDIHRPLPSSSTISIELSGDLRTLITIGSKLRIPAFTTFRYDNLDLILTKGFVYTFTEDDLTEIYNLNEDYIKKIILDDNSEVIPVSEGLIKEKIIEGSTNKQINQIFQKYIIPDTSFSDKFGESDFINQPVTRVWVGNEKSDLTEFIINRDSLLNDDVVDAIINEEVIKCCLIKTNKNEEIELSFGNSRVDGIGVGIGAQIINEGGPSTTFDNIYIEYLSTIGSKGNRVGIVDERLICSDIILLSNGKDITDNIIFRFNSNLVNGEDIENIESIKINAPNSFYSMKRSVSGRDYINILKTIRDPVVIKNAIAWGEQQEAEAIGAISIQALYNIILFSCMGSLYNTTGDINNDTFTVKTSGMGLEESILDLIYNENGLSSQSYFNIYIKEYVAKQLKEYVTTSLYYIFNDLLQVVDYNSYYFSTTYQSDTPIKFYLRSFKYVVNDSEDKTMYVNLDGATSMDDVALKLQTAFRSVLDTRSNVLEGVEVNENLNDYAFPGVIVTWDNINHKFIITFDIDDPCYIEKFYYNSVTYKLTADLGFYNVLSSSFIYSVGAYSNINSNLISKQILDVIDILNKKSQITCKHIYNTPVIQNFKITGDVFIGRLYDLEDMRKKINNQIYYWLNKNINFNTELNLSSISKIIDSFNGVINSSIKFEPHKETQSIYNTFFHSSTYNDAPYIGEYENIDKYGADAISIYNAIYYTLTVFFGTSINKDSDWISFINNIESFDGNNSDVTYRKFITDFIKGVYSRLVGSLGVSTTVTKFQDTQDFLNTMSDICKDIGNLIKLNMLDDDGNIAAKYITSINDYGINSETYVSGGYSIGSEIIKMTSEINYRYK